MASVGGPDNGGGRGPVGRDRGTGGGSRSVVPSARARRRSSAVRITSEVIRVRLLRAHLVATWKACLQVPTRRPVRWSSRVAVASS